MAINTNIGPQARLPRRIGPEFFEQHRVSELMRLSETELGRLGRLTHPMRFDTPHDRLLPVSWDEAFAEIGGHLRSLGERVSVEFGASGCTSTEAIFLHHLLAEEYGGHVSGEDTADHATIQAPGLKIYIRTRLDRSCLSLASLSFILPCLDRSERDEQASGLQTVTVEHGRSALHASCGRLAPASMSLRSEPWIIAGIAEGILSGSVVDWRGLVADYEMIRRCMQARAALPGVSVADRICGTGAL